MSDDALDKAAENTTQEAHGRGATDGWEGDAEERAEGEKRRELDEADDTEPTKSDLSDGLTSDKMP